MSDSFVSYDLNFEEDRQLLEVSCFLCPIWPHKLTMLKTYTGAMTSIRTGRLMEDLE